MHPKGGSMHSKDRFNAFEGRFDAFEAGGSMHSKLTVQRIRRARFDAFEAGGSMQFEGAVLNGFEEELGSRLDRIESLCSQESRGRGPELRARTFET